MEEPRRGATAHDVFAGESRKDEELGTVSIVRVRRGKP